MPAINYQARFAPLVEKLHKRQTIRAWRKRPFRPDDTLYHYTGMRTPQCRRLLTSVCLSALPILIVHQYNGLRWIQIDGIPYTKAGLDYEKFANLDGFKTEGEFFQFFVPKPGTSFTGQLIKW